MFKSRSKTLSLDSPRIMGILNVTPDSFSDGGRFFEDGDGRLNAEAVVEHALTMIQEGATIIDVGGESTGPGSREVSLEEELRRVLPVIRGIREKNSEAWISVDTWKAEVARQAIEAGADMINDVMALRMGGEAMATVLAETGVPVVMMYSKDATPRTTRDCVEYGDVVQAILRFFDERLRFAEKHGIRREQIIVDPGMGAFLSGDARYSLEVLRRLREFERLGFPLLVGASRKGFIQEICGGKGPEDRLEGSLAAAMVAVMNGAKIVRVHDVAETRRVLEFCAMLTSR